MTLYGILSEDHANSNNNDENTDNNVPVRLIDGPNIIDVNKIKGKRFPQENCTKYDDDDEIPISICRPLWGADYPDKLFSWYHADCTVEVHDWLLHQLEINQTLQKQHNKRITPDYNLVVISLGIWEAVRPGDCRTFASKSPSNYTRTTTLEEITDATLDLLEQLCTQQPELTVLWRTSGFHKDGMGNQMIQDWNQRVMDRIDQFAERRRQEGKQQRSNWLYVNFGDAIAPRSFGPERIDGDLKPHYGLAARYALLQMMANALADHDYNQRATANNE